VPVIKVEAERQNGEEKQGRKGKGKAACGPERSAAVAVAWSG